MKMYQTKYGIENTVFVFASDDPGWTSKYFRDERNTYLIDKFAPGGHNRIALDMAVLSVCNHSIIR